MDLIQLKTKELQRKMYLTQTDRSNKIGDLTMSTLGGIRSTLGGVQYIAGIPRVHRAAGYHDA